MSEPLAPERETEIRTRELLATRGPWGLYEDATGRVDVAADLTETGHGYRCRRGIAQLDTEPIDNDKTHRDWTEAEDNEQVRIDAEFIAHAREDVPALLAELDRVRAERDQYANHLDGIHLAQWEDKQETSAEQALRIEETNPAAAFTHDCGIPLTRRLDCGHCPHEICQDCDRCPHTCRCGSEGGDR